MIDTLQEISAVKGVSGVFVCDAEGALLARVLPRTFDAAALERIGRLGARTFDSLQAAGVVGDVDLLYGESRLILKNLGKGILYILCAPQINPAFLNLTANVGVRKIQQSLEKKELPRPQAASPPPKVEKLKGVIVSVLGSQGAKALDILSAAGKTPADLLKALDEIEKMTRLFISKKKADELGSKMRDIIAE